LIFFLFRFSFGLFFSGFLFRFLDLFQLEQPGLIGLGLRRLGRLDRLGFRLLLRRRRGWRFLRGGGILGALLDLLHPRHRVGIHADQLGLQDAGLRLDLRRFDHQIEVEYQQPHQRGMQGHRQH
jgi:hypothetical protein